MMDETQTNLDLARRYFVDAWNPRNVDVVDEIFAPTFTMVAPSGSEREATRDSVSVTIERWHDGFADYHYTIHHEAMGADGTALFFTTFSGTHVGRFRWLNLGPWEATGNSMKCFQAFAFGVTGGRIRRFTSVWDQAHLAAQLGVEL